MVSRSWDSRAGSGRTGSSATVIKDFRDLTGVSLVQMKYTSVFSVASLAIKKSFLPLLHYKKVKILKIFLKDILIAFQQDFKIMKNHIGSLGKL